MMYSKRGLAISGAAVAMLGVLALAVPAFVTQQTNDVVKVGDLRLTTKEETSHNIPPFLGYGALAAGIVLIGAAVSIKR
jgi:hypothetical protein